MATWSLTRRPDESNWNSAYNADGTQREIITLERVDEDGKLLEQLRFSPNMTNEELARYVKDVNRRQNHDRNAEEVD